MPLNVKDFGAIGDGVADDRAAIQAAIDAASAAGGGTVYMPGGTYKVSKAGTAIYCLLLKNGVRLEGEGPTRTRIINAGGSANDMYTVACINVSDFGVAHLTIDGNQAGNTQEQHQHCLWFNGAKRGHIHNVHCTNAWGDGMYLYEAATEDILIENCRVWGNNRSAITVNNNPRRCNIVNNWLVGRADSALDFESEGTDFYIAGNHFSMLQDVPYTVTLQTSTRVQFVNNHVANGGLLLHYSADVRVLGNHIEAGTTYGIYAFRTVSRATIQGNVIVSDTACAALYLLGGTGAIPSDLQVLDNQIHKTGAGYAVNIEGVASVMVAGNRITGAGMGLGIRIRSTLPIEQAMVHNNQLARLGAGAWCILTVLPNPFRQASVIGNQVYDPANPKKVTALAVNDGVIGNLVNQNNSVYYEYA